MGALNRLRPWRLIVLILLTIVICVLGAVLFTTPTGPDQDSEPPVNFNDPPTFYAAKPPIPGVFPSITRIAWI